MNGRTSATGKLYHRPIGNMKATGRAICRSKGVEKWDDKTGDFIIVGGRTNKRLPKDVVSVTVSKPNPKNRHKHRA